MTVFSLISKLSSIKNDLLDISASCNCFYIKIFVNVHINFGTYVRLCTLLG